jgi:hypothetical protein
VPGGCRLMPANSAENGKAALPREDLRACVPVARVVREQIGARTVGMLPVKIGRRPNWNKGFSIKFVWRQQTLLWGKRIRSRFLASRQ